MKKTRSTSTEAQERVLLVGMGLKRPPRVPGQDASGIARESLEELAELARSAGAVVGGQRAADA